VYRDISALEEAGVPIIGEAGTGFCLMEGYRIPPTMFTEQEISALLTVQKLIRNNKDKSLQESLGNLIVKVKAILKQDQKDMTEKLENRVIVFSDKKSEGTNHLIAIQPAILQCSLLKIKYYSKHSDIVTERIVEPLSIYFTKENWILIAWCHLRNDLREFRIDRILELTRLLQTFKDRDFIFEDYLKKLSEK